MKSGVGAGSLDLRLEDADPVPLPYEVVATVALRVDRGVPASWKIIICSVNSL